jgi:predicted O-methyltransferase YrrM
VAAFQDVVIMTETEAPGTRWARLLEEDYLSRLAYWSDIREQLPLLYAAAASYDAPEIAELGTRTGHSTSALLAGAAETGGHVWSVDPGMVVVPPWWEETGLWSFLHEDDMSEQAAAWVPAELDILFIDTSHTYDHTLAELRRYVPRVLPGGTVLCHDPELRHDDTIMGGDWVNANLAGPEYPVAAALDAYCAEAGLAWERQSDRAGADLSQPFYGLGTLLIPSDR